MKRSSTLASVIAALIAAPSTPQASLIGLDFTGEVLEIDEATASAMLIGKSGFGQMTSLAVDGSGSYYATTFPGEALVTIDPVTGLGQFVANLDLGGDQIAPLAMAFDASSDTLYLANRPSGSLIGPSDLWTIDVTTGIGNFIAPIALDGVPREIFSMDFAENGTLFAWDLGAGAPGPGDGAGLVTIDPLTGTANDVSGAIGTEGANIVSIVFQGDGSLYGSSGLLFSIDRVSGVPSEVGPIGPMSFIGGLEVLVPIPEPSALALETSALAILAGLARRGRWRQARRGD